MYYDIPNKEYMIARIVKVVPCAIYMRKVYDQVVTIELENKELLHIFDTNMLCTDNYINKKVKIKILVILGAIIEKVKSPEQMIYNPDIESGNPGGNCVGKVEKIIKTDYVKVLLDVGIGKVMVGVPGPGTKRKNVELDYSNLKVGDYLKITGARFDLKEIEISEKD